MIILLKLLVLAIILYFFINIFLDNFDDRQNGIAYKIYIFLFVFIIQFIFHLISNLTSSTRILINEIIETSINNSLLAVIAFDIYNDLEYINYFKTYNKQQKILMLILLIIGFMTIIKFIQLLISN